jgi:serine/threonine-protein kinase
VLLVGLGAYWFFATANRPSVAAQPTAETTNTTKETAAQETPQEDPEQRIELARQRYQAQVIEATKSLDAQTFGGKTGLFGGVKELSVRLENPTLVSFKQVAVQVQYIKENGDLFRSTVMYFNNIGPNAIAIRRAPDSQRGTRFSARVLRADAERPDSIAVPTPLTP